MVLLLLVFLFGPAETIAGKYLQHSPQYRQRHPVSEVPLPEPLPPSPAALCRLIENGHATPDLFAALGGALAQKGDMGLAYRAFLKAHRLRPKDAAWGRRMQARMDRCPRIPDAVIAMEEREAAFWVARLHEFEDAALGRGEEPDLEEFYRRYGRPEDDLAAHGRARRIAWAGGVAGLLVGLAVAVASPRLRRRFAWLPAAVGGACLLGAYLAGEPGLFYWGAGASFAGAILVAFLGKR